jgi:hypothetical protein
MFASLMDRHVWRCRGDVRPKTKTPSLALQTSDHKKGLQEVTALRGDLHIVGQVGAGAEDSLFHCLDGVVLGKSPSRPRRPLADTSRISRRDTREFEPEGLELF